MVSDKCVSMVQYFPLTLPFASLPFQNLDNDYYNITVNVLKLGTLYSTLFRPEFCFLCNSFLKYLIAELKNGGDLDQTAPDLGLHCLLKPFCRKLCCMEF